MIITSLSLGMGGGGGGGGSRYTNPYLIALLERVFFRRAISSP